MPRKTINQIEVASQRVLMRVEFNVPMDDSGAITDDRRIRLALPSIRSVIERGGKLVLMSHRGRPMGNGYESALSLKPASDRLGQMLEGVRVIFPGEDCIGEETMKSVETLGDGQVLVLENLRFHAAEKAGDENFAARLASFGDIYCNEAFGTAHRSDASMVAVPQAMEGKPRVAGLLLQRELTFLREAIEHPKRPFVVLLGGAKVSDKIGAIHNLIGNVDTILVGGAMAYTLLQAVDHDLGASLVEPDKVEEARRIIEEAKSSMTELLLPRDHVCGKELSHQSPVKVTGGPDIPDDWLGLDIGPLTREAYMKKISTARTIIWNGPMGVFEIPPFDEGTNQLARAIVSATESGAISIVAGGDSAAAVEALGLADRFSHVSTGGGASLHMLEGRTLLSVELLD